MRDVSGVVRSGMVCLLALFVAAASASAQQSASSIAGVVRDTSGAVVPGVLVEAASDALIEKVRTATTDDSGQFRIIDLRPGTYTVTFSLTGFSTIKREGLTLTTGFTAQVNAEMRVGALDETITVSGSSPLVDITNVAQRRVLERDLLDSVPTGKTIQAYATLTVGAIVPATSQDVGGSRGELAIAIGIHGNRQQDLKLLMDGMRFNSMEGTAGGAGRGFYVNAASAQEVTLQTDGNSAEFETGGVMLNVIPKEGGNRFSGYFFGNYTNDSLQGANLNQSHRDRGLQVANNVRYIWDGNGAIGGPIKQDKLWFYTAHRTWGNSTNVAGNFYNANQGGRTYVADSSKRAYLNDHNQSDNIRFTWQATPKQKVNLHWDIQDNCVCHTGLTALLAPEATPIWRFHPNYILQGSWSYPVTNKLLFEAGNTSLIFDWPNLRQEDEGVTIDTISILEQATNYRYNSSIAGYGNRLSKQSNQRFSMSYVTGSHNFKAGLFLQEGWRRHVQDINQSIAYTLLNGVPQSVTVYANPTIYKERLKANVGLFAQDQWTVNRFTLSAGLRFDYLNSFIPEQELSEGRFVPARTFARVDNVPNWRDISPRFGMAWDIFGDGKTAVKFSLGRFVVGEGVTLARANNPVLTTVNSATRTWSDGNNDFVPQDAELGPLSNTNFGRTVVTTTYADDVLTGFGNRGASWQLSGTVQRELINNVSLNVGYFRTWYSNFMNTENVAVTASDFDQFCLPAPSDSRLPGGGGYQVCGLYDAKPSAFGRVTNVINQSSKYGEQSEVFNGVDVTLSTRLGRGAVVSGGMSTGRIISDWCQTLGQPQLLAGATGSTALQQSANDPSNQDFCRQTQPWSSLTQFKLFGSLPLPWGLQASGTFQNLPGIPIQATYTATSAIVTPYLGRGLSSGARGTKLVNLITPFTEFEDRITQLDARITKVMRVPNSSKRFQLMFDLYNVLNASPILAINTTYGPQWQRPTQILDARLFKFGAQFDF